LKHGPLARISRRLKLSFTLFWGKWFLPIPRDDKLLYVAGKPIEIPKIAEPSQDEIDFYHKKYVAEVVRIFDTYKNQAGKLYEEKSLFID
jgi:2-acylglycerol O-acyltransferase 2